MECEICHEDKDICTRSEGVVYTSKKIICAKCGHVKEIQHWKKEFF